MERQEAHTIEIYGACPDNVNVSALRTIDEITDDVRLSKDRILELCELGYFPHYRVDGGEPLFRMAEVRPWVTQNFVVRCEGRRVPVEFRIVDPKSLEDPGPARPPTLAFINELVRVETGVGPGVYFLCHYDNVVYVGQSIVPGARIAQHTDKTFDRVYMLHLPRQMLDAVEGAFIRALKPKYNGTTWPRDNGTDIDVLQQFGFPVKAAAQ